MDALNGWVEALFIPKGRSSRAACRNGPVYPLRVVKGKEERLMGRRVSNHTQPKTTCYSVLGLMLDGPR